MLVCLLSFSFSLSLLCTVVFYISDCSCIYLSLSPSLPPFLQISLSLSLSLQFIPHTQTDSGDLYAQPIPKRNRKKKAKVEAKVDCPNSDLTNDVSQFIFCTNMLLHICTCTSLNLHTDKYTNCHVKKFSVQHVNYMYIHTCTCTYT